MKKLRITCLTVVLALIIPALFARDTTINPYKSYRKDPYKSKGQIKPLKKNDDLSKYKKTNRIIITPDRHDDRYYRDRYRDYDDRYDDDFRDYLDDRYDDSYRDKRYKYNKHYEHKDSQRIIVSPDRNYNLDIDVWTDESNYHQGEPIRVYYRTNRDAYVYIFNTDAHGQTRQIFPNYYDKSNYARAGRTYSLPDRGYDLKVVGPSGRESVKAYAYKDRCSGSYYSFSYSDPFPRRNFSYSRRSGGYSDSDTAYFRVSSTNRHYNNNKYYYNNDYYSDNYYYRKSYKKHRDDNYSFYGFYHDDDDWGVGLKLNLFD